MNDDLDKILDELKNDESITSLADTPKTPLLDITDENVNNYVMQKIGKLVESGIETVEAIQNTLSNGFEAEELAAFSGLISSVAKAAETLNKINIQNKKDKAAKELKEMDIRARRELPAAIHNAGDTNILIATREEIIERFLDKNKKIIEGELIEHDTTTN